MLYAEYICRKKKTTVDLTSIFWFVAENPIHLANSLLSCFHKFSFSNNRLNIQASCLLRQFFCPCSSFSALYNLQGTSTCSDGILKNFFETCVKRKYYFPALNSPCKLIGINLNDRPRIWYFFVCRYSSASKTS